MSGYTKLFSSILMSSIWEESAETRLVWVTMLALADQNGHVDGTVKSLARVSRVTIPECETALKCLLGSDPDDRSGVMDGQRIVPESGGWRLVNYQSYRAKMSMDERRERDKIRKREARLSARCPQTSANVRDVSQAEAEAEADTEAKAEQKQQSATATRPTAAQAPGALAGTLPRDHLTHAFCGARFCVSAPHFSKLARAWGDGGESVLEAWLRDFDGGLTGGYGGPVWLAQHWDAHLVASGRVQPAPAVKPKKPDWKAEVLARDAAKGQA